MGLNSVTNRDLGRSTAVTEIGETGPLIGERLRARFPSDNDMLNGGIIGGFVTGQDARSSNDNLDSFHQSNPILLRISPDAESTAVVQ